MRGLGGIALTTNLLLQLTASEPDNVLLTVPQRDSLRPRTAPASLSVSADGRHVAFVSYARLVAADTNDRADIYVLDRLTGAVTLESLDVDGAPLQGDSGHPRISGDGRRVVFDTAVIEGEVRTPTVQVLIRDRAARSTVWVSRTADGKVPNAWSREPAISADGSVVVFASAATDLVPGRDENGVRLDVYRYDVATRDIRRISVDTDGVQRPEGNSYDASVSATGRYVAFVSTAKLVGGSPGRRPASPLPSQPPVAHIYLRDLRLGVTTRLTQTPAGEPADAGSWAPAVSGDGRQIVFASAASNLVPDDRNQAPDVFLHETISGITTLVSRSAHRGTANGSSINPAISADGRFIAFQSDASDLVCASRCTAAQEDINLVFDVFLFDRRTRIMSRVSAGPKGWEEESGGPAISADGQVVGFTSRHPIDGEDTANDFDLFVSVDTNRR